MELAGRVEILFAHFSPCCDKCDVDPTRQIRFLYPPLICLGYLLWLLLSNARTAEVFSQVFRDAPTPTITFVGTLVAGGVVVVVIGFILGTFTYSVMRLLSLLRGIKSHRPSEWIGWQTHEAWFSEDDANDIWRRSVGLWADLKKRDIHLATVRLDFALIDERVHQWIERRWNAFNISLNTVIGILLVKGGAQYFAPSLPRPNLWAETGWALVAMFLINAFLAFKDSGRMLVFCSQLPEEKKTR
ncbi:MAG: hypothetical protein HZA32_01395 [Opitutae bacterium]|nr:hypothetical protein [Opitutae bacterium]